MQDGTLTDALARRDVLRLRHSVFTSAPDAAVGNDQRAFRQLRCELRMILRCRWPSYAVRPTISPGKIREVDTVIQRMNWEVDLLE